MDQWDNEGGFVPPERIPMELKAILKSIKKLLDSEEFIFNRLPYYERTFEFDYWDKFVELLESQGYVIVGVDNVENG